MFQQIVYQQAKDLLNQEDTIILDVRDQQSFDAGHIPGSLHLSVAMLNDFCEQTPLQAPILVYCYHGISSQSVAQYLVDQGFTRVYSLTGGYENWKSHRSTSDTKGSNQT